MRAENLNQLPEVASKLLSETAGSRIFAFFGPMGAGKTTLIREICDVLGVKDTVSSPTFSIVNEYTSAAGEKIFHFDFYRIKDLSEAYDLGYEDYFYSGAWCFIEWPEKVAELLPENAVRVEISAEGQERRIAF